MDDSDAWAALRHHGDVDARGARLDFAVNVVRAEPPKWLQAKLTDSIGDLARYPSGELHAAALNSVAALHARPTSEVMLLSGAAEAFALLPHLKPTLAAVVHPSFTEPEVALRNAGVPIRRITLPPPYEFDPALVPDEADLVVVGNPTNPTSVLHSRRRLTALRRPGRTIVVDEAFMDCVVGEPESLSRNRYPDVLVIRSLTKMWGLAGLRCGYLLGPTPLLERLAQQRPHWPVNALALIAISECTSSESAAEARQVACDLAPQREFLVNALRARGFLVNEPAAGPFVLAHRSDGSAVRKALHADGIAVRRCDTFPGLSDDHLRIAVRPQEVTDMLLASLHQLGGLT